VFLNPLRKGHDLCIVIEGTANLSGGRVYLDELIPRLLGEMPEARFVLFGSASPTLEPLIKTGKLVLRKPRVLPGTSLLGSIARLLWREFIFPFRLVRIRPTLVYTTANFFSPLLSLAGVPVVMGIHNLTPFH